MPWKDAWGHFRTSVVQPLSFKLLHNFSCCCLENKSLSKDRPKLCTLSVRILILLSLSLSLAALGIKVEVYPRSHSIFNQHLKTSVNGKHCIKCLDIFFNELLFCFFKRFSSHQCPILTDLLSLISQYSNVTCINLDTTQILHRFHMETDYLNFKHGLFCHF